MTQFIVAFVLCFCLYCFGFWVGRRSFRRYSIVVARRIAYSRDPNLKPPPKGSREDWLLAGHTLCGLAIAEVLEGKRQEGDPRHRGLV